MRALVPNPLVWAYRAAPQNLLYFALKRDKIRPKYKRFWLWRGGKTSACDPALRIAKNVQVDSPVVNFGPRNCVATRPEANRPELQR